MQYTLLDEGFESVFVDKLNRLAVEGWSLNHFYVVTKGNATRYIALLRKG
jgi:hypothetical protein